MIALAAPSDGVPRPGVRSVTDAAWAVMLLLGAPLGPGLGAIALAQQAPLR